MRVLQLIDSLEAGGAERLAVNIANGLSSNIEASFLCATRKEGFLKESLLPEVGYFFLNKKKTIDFKAIKRLISFIKKQNIKIIHAHSTSFFLATMVRLTNPNVIIVWHDHYGDSEFLENRKFKVLKGCSKYFTHIFSVNKILKTWAENKLKFKSVSYLPNFATINKLEGDTKLKGISGKRLMCLANLREQKDHITLFLAFKEVLKYYPEWTLHCIGKDFKDRYAEKVKSSIEKFELANAVYLYGSKPDVYNILKQADIGVLSSKSEGLPLALLEYGFAKLPVVSTKVGQCETVISHNYNGLLVEPNSPKEMAKALIYCIENPDDISTFAERFNRHIEENYSQIAQIETIINHYKICFK
ncbi:glycosyltransferase [Algibacter sp. AS12]|uniref:glycosyltransferase n=1 Tax=Algibacter sp. AS12 TaxID=3135773 RepID=UPI00398AD02F